MMELDIQAEIEQLEKQKIYMAGKIDGQIEQWKRLQELGAVVTLPAPAGQGAH